MTVSDIYSILKANPGYLKKGDSWLSTKFKVSSYDVREAKKRLKEENTNWLIIPDLHMPFEHKDALEFCIYIRDKYNCQKVIMLGDIIDLHFSSFHGISTRAKGADEELELTKKAIKPWYDAFPDAYVCDGNHDNIILRKAEAEGVSKQWIKSANEVLDVPGWKFRPYWEFNNFIATHGTDGKNMKAKLFKYGNKSIVQGHYHTESKIEYVNEYTWTMQLGCLVDREAYAFEYAKNNSRNFQHNVGVIFNGTPIIETLK